MKIAPGARNGSFKCICHSLLRFKRKFDVLHVKESASRIELKIILLDQNDKVVTKYNSTVTLVIKIPALNVDKKSGQKV